MRRTTGILMLASGLAGTAAFSMPMQHHQQHSRSDTALAAVGGTEIMTGLLLAGTAAAVWQEYRTDKFEAVKEFTKVHTDRLQEELQDIDAQVEEIQTALEKEAEETLPEEPVEEAVAAVKEPVKEAVTAVEETVVLPKSEPSLQRTESGTIKDAVEPESSTSLVQKVGKTVEQNKKMQDRAEARKKKKAEEEAEEEEAEKEVITAVLSKENPKKKRGILRKAWRITKKMVAPWRKWENIS